MKKLTAILSLAFICFFYSNAGEPGKAVASFTEAEATATYKKYDIKSGIITYDTKMTMGGMEIKTKKVVYFEDYGVKESVEEYTFNAIMGEEKLSKRDFVKDGFRYSCSPEYLTGTKTKAQGYGVEARFDLEEAATLKDKQFKKIGTEIICGKTCDGFSLVTASGNTKMYGWNHILLKTVVEQSSMKTETVATKIEENVTIPAEKFEVPKGVVITDM